MDIPCVTFTYMRLQGIQLLKLPILAIAFVIFLPHKPAADPLPFAIPPVSVVYPMLQEQTLLKHDLPGSELADQGRNIRGIYLPGHRIKPRKTRQLVQWVVKRVGANAVIIDIKDDRGRVTFTKDVKYADGIAHGAHRRRIPKLVSLLKENGIYVIGRLVCFKDNQFPRLLAKAGARDLRTGKIWRDRAKMAWFDPFSTIAHDYIASVAKAAQEIGFDEIQLDYVRFPVEPSSKYAKYPSREGKTERYEAIAALLAKVDKEISIPLSIDVFGLTAYNEGDPDGLGQSLEHLAPHIDAISPMLYLANWPKRVWENPKPSRTYALVHNAIKQIRNRLGDHIEVRPLLQGFRYRAENYGVSFIQNQINAALNAGSTGYLFWNQSGAYGKVATAWRRKLTPHILSKKQKE